MSVVSIPNLTAAITVSGAEQLEAVQAGVSVRVTSQQIANLAVWRSAGGAPTQYQFWSALALIEDADTLYGAMTPSFNDPAYAQLYTSAFVPVDSPIYALCEATYVSIDMDALMQSALAQPAWG
jgi:hypothetical protein